ncbi:MULTISPECIES: YdbL family protein [Thiomicrorhabdus]|uniref:YdbL family protein n=1 Tax=Thiomicrorhabdus heinhorstiae TaxID=2748010 RepID=A0ABS0BW80_9GAMM|nr:MULTISPECIES: YdbL family protein [Thiomicrorhabdus]MBF6058076.1 YdbL family protein [Thiomicrorhabdus heinhorstiae]
MKKFKLLSVLIASLLLAMSQNAFAMSLSEAMSKLGQTKQEGLVGEQPDGYLGVVKNKNDAKNIVSLINKARKEQYQKMAKEHKLKLSDVEALAGKKAIQKTSSGHYIKVDGKWVKK